MPGWFSTRKRVAALHCSYANRPPQISGRAQDTTRGGAWDRVLHRTIENLASSGGGYQAAEQDVVTCDGPGLLQILPVPPEKILLLSWPQITLTGLSHDPKNTRYTNDTNPSP